MELLAPKQDRSQQVLPRQVEGTLWALEARGGLGLSSVPIGGHQGQQKDPEGPIPACSCPCRGRWGGGSVPVALSL